MAGWGPEPVPARVEAELKGWQEMGQTWQLTFNLGDPFLRCSACDQAVIRLEDSDGRGYVYKPEEASVCVVAHIRQAHANRRLPGVSFDSEPPGGALWHCWGFRRFPGAMRLRPLPPPRELET